MKTIFLTGASGNTGRAVVIALRRNGHNVRALTHSGRVPEGCYPVPGDLLSIDSVRSSVMDCDCIVHLASPRTNNLDAVLTEDIFATGRLLEMWHRGTFVYVSSPTVYGTPANVPLPDNHPYAPECWYDLAKVCNEYQLRWKACAGGAGNRRGIVLRPALLFGSGTRCWDRQWLPYIYEECQSGKVFVFDSEVSWESSGASFIGESDMGEVVSKCLDLNDSGSFNVASGFCRWQDLLILMCDKLGVPLKHLVRPTDWQASGICRLPHSRSLLDCTAFIQKTGFVARQSLKTLVTAFVEKMELVHAGANMEQPL